MFPSNYLIWIGLYKLWGECSHRPSWRTGSIIRFEDIKALELLIEDRQWLEPLSLNHLALEPVFDFILFQLFKIFVVIVEVSRQR